MLLSPRRLVIPGQQERRRVRPINTDRWRFSTQTPRKPMKLKSYLTAGVCIVAVAISGHASAAPASKKASPSPSPSASPAASASATKAASPAAKAPRAVPFRGTVSAVDASASTFTIAGKKESRVFKVTDKTTVTKSGAAGSMADIAADETVTGSYWKQADGTLEAKTVKIGGKADASSTGSTKKSKKSDASASASPSATPSGSAAKK